MKIVIVDGSNDTEAGKACRDYVRSLVDSNLIKVYVGYNIGHGNGLALGIDHVETPFFLTFDSDIEMLKSPFQAMLYDGG